MAYDFETIEELAGKTLTKVDASDENIWFYTTENKAVRLWHQQECCESVSVEETVGDLSDLVGSPILRAEVRTEDGESSYGDLRYTFYELATIKGCVTIRWYGRSNGYYSTRVELTEYDVDDEGDIVWSDW